MTARLSPSELRVLLSPNDMWDWDCIRADLVLLAVSGRARIEDGRPHGVGEHMLVLGDAPAGAAPLPPHVAALHEALRSQAAGDPLVGGYNGGQIRAALEAAWGQLPYTRYAHEMTVETLIGRGLLEKRQASSLFGLLSRTENAPTPAGEAIRAAAGRRLQAAAAYIPRFVAESPAHAVAAAGAAGLLLAAGLEHGPSKKALSGVLGRLWEAAQANPQPTTPAPPEFAITPPDGAWAELGPEPVSPPELERLLMAINAVGWLQLYSRSP